MTYLDVDEVIRLQEMVIARSGGLTGIKRIGHAAMEVFLVLNGHEVDAPVDEQNDVFWRLAAKTLTRDEFTAWVRARVRPLASGGRDGNPTGSI